MDQEKQTWIKTYENTARNPDNWLKMASGFIKAAKEVLGSPQKNFTEPAFRIYMLLNAYAIENAIKCLLITKNPGFIKNGKLIGIDNHDLLQLFQKTGISYSNDVKNLLKRLKTNIEVFGRYPVAKNWKKHKGSFSIKNGGFRYTIFHQNDIEIIKIILEKLKVELGNYGITWEY